MLILMRRPGEAIHIGQNIVVTLISLERNRARIGIEAPREIVVDREEVVEKKRIENASPADSTAGDSPGNADERKRR